MPKLLFFDIDGTLYDDRIGRPPDSVPPALRRARERGCRLFLNTGRTLCNLDRLLDDLPFDGRVLGCGTRVIYLGETIRCLEHDHETSLAIRRVFLDSGLPTVFECDTALYFEPWSVDLPILRDFRDYARSRRIARQIRAEDPEFRAVKMFSFAEDPAALQALMDRLAAGGTPYQAIYRGWNGYEIVPAGCSKASGIDLICERTGAGLADCYVFGDSENDLSMLTHVPNSIAMGNAEEAVKARCSYVTDRAENDGIAKALAHFRLI